MPTDVPARTLTTADLTPERFKRFAEFITRELGIKMSEQKIPMLQSRLHRRLRALGLPSTPDTVNSRIVVLELELDGETTVVGGIADSVHEVIELEPAQIVPPPTIAMRWRSDFIQGMGKRGDEFIILLDINAVFTAGEMTTIRVSATENGVPVATE